MSSSQQEPIAIIGMGCRFPGGVDSPATFWELLTSGSDGVVEVPSDRWNVDRFYDPDPAAPGKMYVKNGAFLTQKINAFDALFFGISPREAGFVDPQQRLLMEVAWEALEDAGLVPERLAGTDTGVYIGGFTADNLLTQLSPLNREHIGSHSAVGTTLTILSNRLSYLFDLRGPSMTIDTACSSALVATHEACQSIWRGECSLALVGGVNMMHRPEQFIAMCKGGFLSPDGRSKSFDSRANGYGRGEGAGVVVLKPYSAALRDGDDIYGLMRATGANQDGRTDGITVPNPEAQQALIRKVCSEAELDPQHIRYIEAHGTGTPVGDPLEARAIGAVLGAGRTPQQACVVGSVKANIGHLEAASGIAGLIKLALCLKHRAIPPLANLITPNPDIPFADLGLRLPRALEPMPAGDGPACVSINSFGFGGTNAHAILQEHVPAAPIPAPIPAPCNAGECEAGECEAGETAGMHVLPLSARSAAALSELAAACAEQLARPDAPALIDFCYSAAMRRGHHDRRLALAADTRENMVRQLRCFLEHGTGAGIAAGSPGAKGHKPVFVFTGMGPQWWAMGRELLQSEPVFRRTAQACDAIFQRLSGWSILAEMMADEASSRMAETQIAQPANFVIQAGLAALWRSWGVEPGAIVGHSVGEVAAAYVAGVLDLEDALLVAYHRSRIQKKAAGLGTMLAVGLPAADAMPYIAPYQDTVSLAASNSPRSITLAGDTGSLNRIAAKLQEQGIFNRFLTVEVPYHSPAMEALKPEILDSLKELLVRPATVALYSTVTGDLAEAGAYDAAYWCRNVREPVFFESAMAALLRDGYRVFLEVGPHPVLSTAIRECLSHHDAQGVLLPSLRRAKPERETLLESLAGLYVAGAEVDWRKRFPLQASFVKLPAYPWQREAYWNEGSNAHLDRVGATTHALLGRRIDLPSPVWESALNGNLLPYLQDHCVQNLVLVPGAAYVELGLAVQREMRGPDQNKTQACLENLEFHKALIVEPHSQVRLHVRYDEATREYAVSSREREGSAWTPHARGRLSFLPLGQPDRVSLDALRGRCTVARGGAQHYSDMHRRGLQYGPYFQGVRELWLGADGQEILALIEEPPELARSAHGNLLHPCLLDACFQSLLAGLSVRGDDNLYVPVQIREVRLYGTPQGSFWCHGRMAGQQGQMLEGDILLCDHDGVLLAEVRGLRAQVLTSKSPDALQDLDRWLYRFAWETAPQEAALPGSGRWLVFCDDDGKGDELAAQLAANGCEAIVRVRRGAGFAQAGTADYALRPDSAEDFRLLLAQSGSPAGVAYLWALDQPTADDACGRANLVSALHLMQALAAQQIAAKVVLVTRHAQPAGAYAELALAQAPLVGFGRVAVNELDTMQIRMVDIDHGADAIAQLAREILSDSREEEVALRAGVRYVNRLQRQTGSESAGEPASADGMPATRRRPGPNELALALESAWSLGAANIAGADATAIVTSAGSEVRGIQAGDRVLFALPQHCGAFLSLPSDAVVRHPIFDDPQSEPLQRMNFIAAVHALHGAARLQRGERILIHAAASPRGLAAIAVAQRAGAVVYASAAGTEACAYLSSLGLVHVFDAGSMQCLDQMRAAAGSRGLDVVLNDDGGEFELRSLALLGSSGRCVNLRAGLAMPALRANQSMLTADLYQLLQDDREMFDMLAAEVTKRFACGDFQPQAESDASMQHAGPRLLRLGTAKPVARFHAGASYLITGGLGGFGLEVARWLVQQGVRNLALVGRSGAAGAEAQQAVQTLRAAGAQVLALAADVSIEADVQRILTEIAASMPPLKGVFHAAAVLNDAALESVQPAQIDAVMQPKAMGAWLLHRCTQDMALDYFVLFSSIGSMVGNPGQSPYVAANAFLDALAHHRRAQNLAATCINWGALAQVGMAAREKGVEQYLNRMGVGSLTPEQALGALDRILDWNPIQTGAAIMHWDVVKSAHPRWAASPRNSQIMAEVTQDGAAKTGQGPLQALLQLAPEARREAIGTILLELVSAILRIPQNKIDPAHSLLNLGMDSLVGLEIQAAIERRTGINVSTLELMKGVSLAALAQHLASRTGDAPPVPPAAQAMPPAAAPPEPAPRHLAAELLVLDAGNLDLALDALSDDEVEQALQVLLGEKSVA